jgi:iron complex transport system ATP-binding protein
MALLVHVQQAGLLGVPGKEDRALCDAALRRVGIEAFAERPYTSLSGGELKLVLLARALAQQTPVLLLDEPVSSLDIAHQLEIMRLLHDAKEKTIVIVIHDLNLALQFCDDLLLFHEGRLVYQGPVAGGLTPENIRTVYGVSAHMADGRIVYDY